jgi:drug/metabolite transporter (DMT)-like permease
MVINLQKALNKDVTHPQAIVLLIATAVLWSFGGLLIKLVDWHPAAIAGGRSVIAALLFYFALGKPKFKMSRSQWAAAFAYAATVILFVFATRLTTAANAILLQYASPVYTILLSVWFLKEKSNIIDWGAIFFVLCGMVLFFVDGFEMGHILGNVLAILSGLSFAVMVVLLKKQRHTSTWEPIFWGNVLTAIAGIPFMTGPFPDLTGIMSLFALGIFQLGLSYIIYTVAIRRVTAVEATLVPMIEPVLNPIWVFLGLGELPGAWAIIGGVLVLLTISLRFIVIYKLSRSNPL